MTESKVRPFGRMFRIVLGALFLIIALPFYLFPGKHVEFLGSLYSSDFASISIALTITGGFVLFYILMHRIVSTYAPNINGWLGAVIANAPPLAVFLLSGGPSQIAVLTYVGFAMLLAGWRRDAGCEVMSVPNVIFRNSNHLACIIFSPIDWAEQKIHLSRKPERN
ncbi:MAG: hypothetical protein ACRECH_05810 [Nitrososphaerales archaeon]